MRALADAPSAFTTTHAEALARDPSWWITRTAELVSSDASALFIAERDRTWLGLVGGEFAAAPTPHVEVISTWIDPLARRAGLAFALLDAVAAWARDGGAQHLQLWVTERNAAAIALYERFGFTSTGESQRVVPSDPTRLEVEMHMPLASTPRGVGFRLEEGTMPWNPGDHITLRWTGHFDGQERDKPGILQGWPHIVVEDRDDLLALWMPGGTRTYHVDLADRTHELPSGVWRTDTLRLLFPGKPFSVALSWATPPDPSWPAGRNPVQTYYDEQRAIRVARGEDPATLDAFAHDEERRLERERLQGAVHEFRGWYVNLEAPFVRTSIGIDTSDNSLDVVVATDLTWRWKDEHTMDSWIAAGVFTREHVNRFYREGREAIADVEARRFPFDGAYLDWLPEAAWGLPQVHPEWDRVPGYDMSHAIGRRLPWTDPPRPRP